MTRASQPIIPIDDAEIDDPDTGLVEALRDSDRPERVLRAQRLAIQKLKALDLRMRQREAPKTKR